MSRKAVFVLAVAWMAVGCDADSGNGSNPYTDPTAQHLYVATNAGTGTILQYPLVLSGSETAAPSLTMVPSVTGIESIGMDPSGNLAVQNAGQIVWFSAPISGSSKAAATFATVGSTSTGEVAFSGMQLFAANGTNGFNVFATPVSDTTKPALSVTADGIAGATGVAVDSSSNVYVTNGSQLALFAPPYSGAPIVTPAMSSAVYGKLVVADSQLLAASTGGTGQVDVYGLPLSATSKPVLSITTGVVQPNALAADAGGNVYVGVYASSTSYVVVYSPPFFSGIGPSFTLILPAGDLILGLAVGP